MYNLSPKFFNIMRLLSFLIIFSFLWISCDKKNNDQKSDCPAIVKTKSTDTIPPQLIGLIDSIRIENHCMILNLGFSGCDSNHDIKLATKGELMESNPVQLAMYFIDNSSEACQAYFTQEYSYDLELVDEIIGNKERVWLVFPYGPGLAYKRILYKK